MQQIFDEGRLTDAQGRTVYFTDTTIVMTIDMDTASGAERSLGFGGMTTVKESTKLTQEQVAEKLKDTFRVIFWKAWMRFSSLRHWMKPRCYPTLNPP